MFLNQNATSGIRIYQLIDENIEMANVMAQDVFEMDYLVQIIPDLVCVIGADGCFKKFNNSLPETLGYSSQELMRYPVTHFIHPDDLSAHLTLCDALFGGGESQKYENRFLTKQGKVVFLFWTIVYAERYNALFCIAKDVTLINQQSEQSRIDNILSGLKPEQIERLKVSPETLRKNAGMSALKPDLQQFENLSQRESVWFEKFESVVRHHQKKEPLTLSMVSSELAITERQLYRLVKKTLNTTPNMLVRIIRLQMAWEAIATGKYRTVTEIAHVAGYPSRAYFQRIFLEVYGIEVSELL
ncbi:helix-turn-helix domain-containing protein [Pedobacter sp. Leaf170]|uniref:helix-turn-helix domain-containing protein n=1 Tax=Pedobacter sp. Leaf170 TaxID=2876558 RepID=UPI001E2FCC6D|nr:helix-turn-helix domain-containing protein [Pedobacter sp. Leaf170]